METSSRKLNVLLIDDDEDDFILIRDMLTNISGQNVEMQWTDGYSSGLNALTTGDYDICLLDYGLGKRSGLDLLKDAGQLGCMIPVILFTEFERHCVDMEAMEAGAVECLSKNEINLALLERAIRYSIEAFEAKQALQLNSFVMETMAEGIFLTGIDDNIIKWTSGRFEEIFGYGPGEMVGMHIGRISTPVEATSEEAGISILDQLLQTGKWRGDIQRVKKDGTVFWCHAHASLYDHHTYGKVMVWACLDISECKRAEEERLRYQQKLDQARKAESLARMAGAIAHNLNNILGALMGNLEMAMDDVLPGTELRTCIDEAIRASQRAAKMTRHMLTYLGRSEAKAEPVNLAAAIREPCALLSDGMPANVHLKAELRSLGQLVNADAAHLTQILTNLVTNAVEAIGEQEGEIALALDVVSGTAGWESRLYPVGWEPTAKEYVCLSVTDTGHGIDPENLDDIFDPFFSTKFMGRGLGLSVVAGLLRTLKGAISVNSDPEHGTTFKVFIPVAEEEEV